jgi:hypothetical protein
LQKYNAQCVSSDSKECNDMPKATHGQQCRSWVGVAIVWLIRAFL